MKFDDLLALYLYENKSLQLQGIGTFNLDRTVVLPQEQDKEIYYPIEGLTFFYSPKDLTNEDLITFLVKKLGKIQPLVRSDLESYLSNIKQFINIGKPYTIEGIGTLQKNNQGIYEFTPGTFLPVKEELSPHKDNAEHLHRQRARKSESGRTASIVMIVIVSIIVLGGIGYGIYYYLNNKSSFQSNEQTASDTSTTDNTVQQTGEANSPSTETATLSTPANSFDDTTTYDLKLIFDITKSKARVFARSAQLRRDRIPFKLDTLTVNDTLRYRMFIPKRLRYSDTLRVKDSLRKVFRKPIYVEKRQR